MHEVDDGFGDYGDEEYDDEYGSESYPQGYYDR